MRKLTLLVTIVLAVMLTVVGGAAIAKGGKEHRAHAHLNGYQEVPLTLSTSGKGKLWITKIDASAKTLDYKLQIRTLEGSLTPPPTNPGAVGQAHLHFGKRGLAGGVIAFLCGGGGKPACATTGTITGTIAAANILGPAGQGIEAGNFDEFLAALKHGAVYANVHTTLYPAGEIRGQVVRGHHHHVKHKGKKKDRDD